MKISKMLDDGKLDDKTVVTLTPMAPWKRIRKVYVITDCGRTYGMDGQNRIWVCHRIYKDGHEVWWCKHEKLAASRSLVGSVGHRVNQLTQMRLKIIETLQFYAITDFWLGTREEIIE